MILCYRGHLGSHTSNSRGLLSNGVPSRVSRPRPNRVLCPARGLWIPIECYPAYENYLRFLGLVPINKIFLFHNYCLGPWPLTLCRCLLILVDLRYVSDSSSTVRRQLSGTWTSDLIQTDRSVMQASIQLTEGLLTCSSV